MTEPDATAFVAAVEAAAREHLGITVTRWVFPYMGFGSDGEMESAVYTASEQISIDTLGLIEYAAVNALEKVKQ